MVDCCDLHDVRLIRISIDWIMVKSVRFSPRVRLPRYIVMTLFLDGPLKLVEGKKVFDRNVITYQISRDFDLLV